jgi:hypothetical protein
MNPPPLLTNSRIARFCVSSNASSPEVSANISTSVAPRRVALTSARVSVCVTTMSPPREATAATAARAAGMESCRNPAVAVSISTRTGCAAGGAVVVVDDGDGVD